MTTVFIAGSISISRLHEKVVDRIRNVVSSNFRVVVGDADGADTSIQNCLQICRAKDVTVYCTGDAPRNNVAGWPIRKVASKAKSGTRAFFTAKDLEMARESDYGLMIWDSKSTGTLSNVIELLRAKKKSVVFINNNSEFITISNKDDLDHLVSLMSHNDLRKAEAKIGLNAKIESISQEQFPLDVQGNMHTLHDQAKKIEITSPVGAGSITSESAKLRAALMESIRDYISHSHLNQSQAARVFGVTQPRISDLTRGKVELFGLDALVNMAASAGLVVEMHISKGSMAAEEGSSKKELTVQR